MGVRLLWVQPEAQVDVVEMTVAGENVCDNEVLHDHHAGEIDKRDVWFVVILLAEFPGPVKLLRR